MSAPSSEGRSILISRPVRTPGPMKMGLTPVSLSTAPPNTGFSGLTTEDTAAPRIFGTATPYISRMAFRVTAYSSTLRLFIADRREEHTMTSPSKTPTVMVVLPISATNSIWPPPFVNSLT